ncbi:cell division protein FtsA [Chloroflexota bacterium]
MAAGNIACIDIGSTKICTVIANVSDGRVVQILGVGNAPSRGVQKGIIVDIDDATIAIKESLEKAEVAAPKVGAALIGFSGKHISSTNPMVSVDTHRRDHLVGEVAIDEAEGKIQAVVFPEDRVKVNIVKRQWSIDRVGGIRNPLGMHGFRLDLEAHIVTADYGYMENLIACLRRSGVAATLGDFVANPLAAGESVLEPEDKERGVILADIGGGTTGIAVYREGSVWHTSALPVGGRQVTNDLAVGLSIPFSAAEELKVGSGTLYPEEIKDARTEILEKHNTSPEELSYIIRARVEEILRMIVSKSPQRGNESLVITGGTANLPGMEQFAREVLGLQVRIGVPTNLPQGGELLNDPSYASVVGLLLWGAELGALSERRHEGRGGGWNPFSGLRSTFGSFWNRLPRISFSPPKSEEG